MSQSQLQERAILELIGNYFLQNIAGAVEAEVAHKNWDQHGMLQKSATYSDPFIVNDTALNLTLELPISVSFI
jgi:hypothetical protein